jgi:hypothetical protein
MFLANPMYASNGLHDESHGLEHVYIYFIMTRSLEILAESEASIRRGQDMNVIFWIVKGPHCGVPLRAGMVGADRDDIIS